MKKIACNRAASVLSRNTYIKWNIGHNIGLLGSVVFHVLIISIPVSIPFAEKVRDKGMELFVVYEGSNVIQEGTVDKPTVLSAKKGLRGLSRHNELKREKIAPAVEESTAREYKDLLIQKATNQYTETLQEHRKSPTTTVKQQDHSTSETGKATVLAQRSLPRNEPLVQDVKFGVAAGPNFLHKELPIYPPIAKRLGREGRVVLRLTIDERGNLIDVEVLEKAGYGFTEAAVQAVRRSTFLPAKKNGKPITSRVTVPIRFTLGGN